MLRSVEQEYKMIKVKAAVKLSTNEDETVKLAQKSKSMQNFLEVIQFLKCP